MNLLVFISYEIDTLKGYNISSRNFHRFFFNYVLLDLDQCVLDKLERRQYYGRSLTENKYIINNSLTQINGTFIISGVVACLVDNFHLSFVSMKL